MHSRSSRKPAFCQSLRYAGEIRRRCAGGVCVRLSAGLGAVNTTNLLQVLRGALGNAAVITDPAELVLAAADILPDADAVLPAFIVRPRNTDETAKAIRLLAEDGMAVVPRGAGLSYTGGVVPQSPGAVIDTTAMTDVTVVADDLYAIVGAGCTWQTLADRLKPFGLRTVVSAPISGSHSTIGGAASQSVTNSEGFIGVTVVLADGSVLRAGGWTTPGGVPFLRHYGPDLTGLFLGDCGAFGVDRKS